MNYGSSGSFCCSHSHTSLSLAAFNGGVSPAQVRSPNVSAFHSLAEPTSPYKDPFSLPQQQPQPGWGASTSASSAATTFGTTQSLASFGAPQPLATTAQFAPQQSFQAGIPNTNATFQSFGQPLAQPKTVITKLLLLIALCYKKNLISNDEKSLLKVRIE